MSEDILIHVDNTVGSDANPGTRSSPLATADEAFRRLPPYWHGRAEIVFAVTYRDYPVTTDAVYLGMPVGPEASPLVIRGGYDNLFVFRAADGTGDNVISTIDVPEDKLIGAVLTRLTGGGSPAGTAISIRGNDAGPNSKIWLQRTMGPVVSGDTFRVQRPAVTLAPVETLNLTSHDERSLNLTLVGIRFAPTPGAGINLFNVCAQCDTCELALRNAAGFIHTGSRIQGGIEDGSLAPGLCGQRGQAGVYIHSNEASDLFSAVRGGILGGHLTFQTVNVRVSQGGVFAPQSLEALAAPVHILAGGSALAQLSWGTPTNRARIRNVFSVSRTGEPEGDGLRVFNGGALNSPLGPINLDIYGCNRDGVRLDVGATASFCAPGAATGLVTSGALNGGFGMNVRNASRALVGGDTALKGGDGREVALDDVAVEGVVERVTRRGWAAVTPETPRHNEGLSLVRRNT
jgi:hypothetical protein